ncbi:3-hydroxybutyryl-CoA dehydrogenase [Psychroflexus sp. YR1-1]|uniref:3-hydroxybutyryl-CoA dehydrogenase n=1 Tax=Psychroflexus aurantiacus TaxID=2709310 RepID=A0A6B3R315_9FLAO|nr:3-hydroxyacyl-CoA dehydrogenase NAD-binding domain-containing protein [Psychroflexus aurantiacus]NEV94903.1 3-hydroxybutyryl-CoA dehydrogenase [Psychroflexus aurantiacus]
MKVAIIGSGTMGSGIAQVAATAGCQVQLYDTKREVLEQAKQALEKILNRLIEKGRMDEAEKTRIQSNISYEDTLKSLAKADLTIEAIIEHLEIKQKVFKELESYQSKEAIIATNTSSLSIASIASVLAHPERCIGVHFFNPAPLMPLVEIVPAVQTSQEVFDKVFSTIQDWKKVPVKAQDTPGFIVNRVARPFYGEALRIYEERYAGVPEGEAGFATIDWAMKAFGGFKMGPFQLMDFIGNDVNYTVTETVFKAFYFDPRYKPSFTQKRFAEAGYLGRKSGRGFYNYSEDAQKAAPVKDREMGQKIFDRVLVMLINEAADALFLNIATAKDIDLAMTKGVNYPKGLLTWANEKGITWCVERLDHLYDIYREDRYRCSPLLRKMKEKGDRF